MSGREFLERREGLRRGRVGVLQPSDARCEALLLRLEFARVDLQPASRAV